MNNIAQRSGLLCLLTLIPLAFGGAYAGAAEPPPGRRNVVLILADDLGFMDIGCNNPRTFHETPNIDRLAAQGMRFTRGYAACPVCSPTRASILTGKVPARTGITNFIGGAKAGKLRPAPYQHQLSLEEVTLAEAMRDAGFATFFAGKWHLGEGAYSPNDQGFGPGLVGEGQFYYPPRHSPPRGGSREDPKATDVIADAAVEFIKENRDRPFFAYLPFLAVHIPLGARADLIAKYQRKLGALPPISDAEGWGTEGKSKVRLVQRDPTYAAVLEQLDLAIGRVLAAIKSEGLADRTVVVFTSDNGGLSTSEGYPTSNIPLRGGKGWVYEGGIRVPWIISALGVTKPGSLCETPVLSTDLYPTLLALAGAPKPRTLDPSRDGVDITPLLEGRELKREAFYWHYPHYSNQGGSPAGAVREGDWKLIEWYEDGQLELYNLRDDPDERKNLAAVDPARAKTLQAQLAQWRKQVNARMPMPPGAGD